MHRPGVFAALALATLIALAPALAFARAGGGGSFGSRGSRTYSAPPSTSTAPYTAAPMQRSMTAPAAPSQTPLGANPAMGGGFGGRSPFVSGLMGGLIGAGIGGLLFGGGLFSGIDGFGGFLGLLLQIGLVVLIGRWLFRRVFAGRQPAFAGAAPGAAPGPARGGMFARAADPQAARGGIGGGGPGRRLEIGPADYAAFERVLRAVQSAWSAHDLGTMRQITTPEMTSYFAEQLAEQTSRGVTNKVENVQLQQGDLSEAWGEPNREYATVAMRFSMTDVTYDTHGRVVDGDPTERVQATEVWTFMRAIGGNWVLSGIQQAR